MGFLSYVIPFLIVFTIIVFVHELGHYWVARLNGVKIDVFSIGFGPELIGFTDRHKTRWRLSAVPLGGYVRMYGDADAASTRPDTDVAKADQKMMEQHSLHHKSPWQKAAVAVAGPMANLLFAIVAFFIIFSLKGQPTIPATIAEIQVNSLASKIGLQSGDEFVSFNDKPVTNFMELRQHIQKNAGHDVSFYVKREEKNIRIDAKLYTIDEKTGDKIPTNQLGITPGPHSYKPLSLKEAVINAVEGTWAMSAGFFATLPSLITNKESREQIGGIMAMGEQASKSYNAGFWVLLNFMAILSINLGVINLLPIPMLDGGQIAISLIEGVIRRDLPEKFKEFMLYIGLAIVASLMLLSTWNDVERFIMPKLQILWDKFF